MKGITVLLKVIIIVALLLVAFFVLTHTHWITFLVGGVVGYLLALYEGNKKNPPTGA